MKIIGDASPVIGEKFKPLFEAMKNGKKIRSVIFFKGTNNLGNENFKFEIKNFTATMCYANLSNSSLGTTRVGVDSLIETDQGDRFYFDWIVEFEL